MVEKKLANVEKAHRLYNEFGGRSDGEEAEDFQASRMNHEPHHDILCDGEEAEDFQASRMNYEPHHDTYA